MDKTELEKDLKNLGYRGKITPIEIEKYLQKKALIDPNYESPFIPTRQSKVNYVYLNMHRNLPEVCFEWLLKNEHTCESCLRCNIFLSNYNALYSLNEKKKKQKIQESNISQDSLSKENISDYQPPNMNCIKLPSKVQSPKNFNHKQKQWEPKTEEDLYMIYKEIGQNITPHVILAYCKNKSICIPIDKKRDLETMILYNNFTRVCLSYLFLKDHKTCEICHEYCQSLIFMYDKLADNLYQK